MNDSETKMLFSRLVEGEPPVPDIEPFVAAAHTAARRRQLTFAGLTAVAVAAVIAAVAVTPSLGLGVAVQPNGQVAGPGLAVSTAPDTSKLPASVPPHARNTETPAQTSARLTAAIKAVLKLPAGARVIADPDALKFFPSQGNFKSAANIADPGGVSNLSIDVGESPAGTSLKSGCPPETPPGQKGPAPGQCRAYRTATGDAVLVQYAPYVNGIFVRMVSVLRVDGTGITVMCENTGPNSNGEGKNPSQGPQPTRSVPLLTDDDLLAIALDPRMSYLP